MEKIYVTLFLFLAEDIFDQIKDFAEYRVYLYDVWLNYYVYQQTPYEFIDTAEIIGK